MRLLRQDGYTFVEAEARAAALMLISDPRLGRLWVACDGDAVGYVTGARLQLRVPRARGVASTSSIIAESYAARPRAARGIAYRGAAR